MLEVEHEYQLINKLPRDSDVDPGMRIIGLELFYSKCGLVPATSASPEVYWAFLKSQLKSVYQNLQVIHIEVTI